MTVDRGGRGGREPGPVGYGGGSDGAGPVPVTEIVKGVVAGGWSILLGWIVPSLVNTAVLAFVVLPGRVPGRQPVFGSLPSAASEERVFGLLLVGLLAGLVLLTLQRPLYRVLEGYLGWPDRVFGWGRRRRLRAKHALVSGMELVRLASAERAGGLDQAGRARLVALRADPALRRYARERTAPQRGLLRERLHRYPVDDGQVTPTRLGNAIRRLEEYGYDRYRLDSQVFWYELSAVVPEHARRQVDNARVPVDFFVCLLYGHLLVATAAIAAATAGSPRWWQLLTAAVVLCALSRLWYHAAVSATDEWAAAVRGMVNLGRAPLARSLGLRLPDTLAAERAMWSLASKVSRLPHDPKAAALDAYRAASEPAVEPAVDPVVEPAGDPAGDAG